MTTTSHQQSNFCNTPPLNINVPTANAPIKLQIHQHNMLGSHPTVVTHLRSHFQRATSTTCLKKGMYSTVYNKQQKITDYFTKLTALQPHPLMDAVHPAYSIIQHQRIPTTNLTKDHQSLLHPHHLPLQSPPCPPQQWGRKDPAAMSGVKCTGTRADSPPLGIPNTTTTIGSHHPPQPPVAQVLDGSPREQHPLLSHANAPQVIQYASHKKENQSALPNSHLEGDKRPTNGYHSRLLHDGKHSIQLHQYHHTMDRSKPCSHHR